jgi:hypothetical protein
VLSLTLLASVTGCANDDVPATGGGSNSASGTGTATETDTASGSGGPTTDVPDGTGSSGLDSTGSGPDSTGSGPDGTGSSSDGTGSGSSSDSGSTGPGEQCGNDAVEGSETCDGSDLAGEGCVGQGFDAGTLACLADCSAFDTAGCVSFVCGNDAIEGMEACDGSDLAGEGCISQGFDAGTLGCLGDCSGYDTSGCLVFSGNCCAAHGTVGCDDAGCTTAVCAADSSCCDTQWDAACAAAAYSLCPAVCDDCGDDVVNSPVEICDGTDLDGQSCTSQGFSAGALACLADCSGFDTAACVAYSGDCCAAHGTPGCDDPGCTAAVCAADPTCCSMQWDPLCAAAAVGELACQGVGGSCPTPVCGNDLVELGETCDGTDLVGQSCTSLGFDGGVLGCLADCSALDTSGCFDYAGDCCAANGTPGCDDPGCTAAICAADPTCCNAPWDAACAAAAVVEPACQDVGGSCPACGDGVIEGLEACDGANLLGETCISQGFDGGTLTCQPDCSALNTGACQLIGFGDCVNNPPAAVCLPGEQCITDLAVPPTVGVCTDVSCANVTQCPLAPPGGTAPVQCVDVTGEGINECILFCGLPGLLCPPGMVCQLGLACAWPA